MFMGTPEISATALRRLIDEGFEVCAVVTGQDKQRGRGNEVRPTPTRAEAEKHGIEVLTPTSLRTEEFMEELSRISPDIIVVVAFGKILPRSVLDFPPLGCINLHVSLLPKYRGAAPMQRAIMEGESETGVTIMYMAEGLDTGDIISQERFPIGARDDFEAIHDRSAEVGSLLLCTALRDIEAGRASRTPQNEAEASYAAKVEKTDGKIDFSLSAEKLDFIIRGTTPIPGAYAYKDGRLLKIFNAEPISAKGKVGEVVDLDSRGEGYFTVACGEGALKIRGVIPEGKGRMTAGDFIRGRKIQLGDVLE